MSFAEFAAALPKKGGVLLAMTMLLVGTALATGPDTRNVTQADVAAMLDKRAATTGGEGNWRTSIVSLMKLVGLDSRLPARQALARELDYKGDLKSTAAMNVWLHGQLMARLVEGGGKLPSAAPQATVGAAPVAKGAAVANEPPVAKEPAAAKEAPTAKEAAVVKDAPLSARQRKEIEAVIKDYLLNNPEVMLEVQAALEAKLEKLQAEKTAAVLKSHAAEIFRPKFSPVVGNPKGDVTIIEFFDYNCGFCKKALADVSKLIEREKQVKVILKELPIFKGSDEAAKVALAAKMQGKYWEFHSSMLRASGQANEASALRVAQKVGLDMAKLKKDMASPEVAKELEDTRLLAEKLQVRGTPFFMVADRVIPGAPADLLDQMAKHVADVRREGGCKVC